MDAWVNSLDGVQFVCLLVGAPAAFVALVSGCMALYFAIKRDMES